MSSAGCHKSNPALVIFLKLRPLRSGVPVTVCFGSMSCQGSPISVPDATSGMVIAKIDAVIATVAEPENG